MRICFVSSAGSAHTRKWCGWFVSRGHEVHVISFIPAEIPGVRVHPVDLGVDPDGSDWGKLKYLTAGGRIRKLLRTIRPDAVNVHYATSYGVAAALSGAKGYALSVWGSDIYDFPRRSPLHRALLQFSLRKAGVLFSTSRAMAEEAAKYTDRPFEITPFGVDMALFSPDRRTRGRSGTGGADGTFVIGTVKTMAALYGIGTLIRAFSLLCRELPEAKLRLKLCGDGPQEAEFRRLAEDEGIAERTEFTGRIPAEECARAWADMDLAVIPSARYESFGVAAVEAQACGTPLVISEVGGLMETTVPGSSSLPVPPEDPRALADAMKALYLDPERRARMGDAGRRNVLEKYELNRCFERIEALLAALRKGAEA